MGGDYTDLVSWQAGEQIFNWPVLGQNPVAEIYHDWPSGLSTNILLDGWITDASHPPVIRSAVGEGHTGKRLSGGNYTGATLTGTVYEDAVFDINDPNFQIRGLILDIIPARGGGIRSRFGSNQHAQNCYFERLIINNCSKLHGIELTGENDNVRISNVVVTNGAADSYGILIGLRANAWVYNCIVVDCGVGIYIDSSHASADVVLKNNLCHSNNIDMQRLNSLGTLSVSNCASSDGTATTWGGTGNRANQTFTFADEVNDDFHLSASDAGARGYGTDLSGDSNYPISLDIDGETRSTPWDIGADQSAGSGTTPITSDIAIRWDALAAVTADNNLKWNILNALDTDLQLAWNLLNGVTRDQALSWDVLAQLTSDLGVQWDVLSALTAVTSDIGMRWNILNAVQTDVQLAWDLITSTTSDLQLAWSTLNALTANLDLRWSVLQAIDSDVDLRWDLQSALSAVTTDIDLRWDVDSALQSVTSDLDIKWSLLQAVVATLDTRWDLLNAVGADMSMRWDIAQAVVAELNTRWDILNSVSADAALRWDSLEATQSSITLRWSVDGELQFSPITFIKIPTERRVIPVPAEQRIIQVRR